MGINLDTSSSGECYHNFRINCCGDVFSIGSAIAKGILHPTNATILQNIFLLHVEKEYLVVPIDTAILLQARQLVTHHPLRTLDAIQLSCAMHAVTLLNSPMTYVSGDQKLLVAAAAESFSTDDPNAHAHP